MRELSLTIQTITPIWTGGADGKMDRLHETGLMGSLRWWYEVIVRGVGGHACDPTSEKKCTFDKEKYEKSTEKGLPTSVCLNNAGLCDACQVFGTTGWKRRFRLEIDDSNLKEVEKFNIQPTTTGDRYKHKYGKLVIKNGKKQNSAWYFKSKAKAGVFLLKIVPMPDFDPILIHGVLKLIQNYGGLGSKSQLGCGIIKIIEEPEFDLETFIKSVTVKKPEPPVKNLPSLKNMFFVDLLVSDNGMQAVLNLKYDLRNRIREKFSDNSLRHFVFGTVQGENQGSKIFFSQPVNKEIRIWGWIPESPPSNSRASRSSVIDEIKKELEQSQMDPSRKLKADSWKIFPPDDDPTITFSNYLRSLIQRSS
jgi:CRISPR-associated protein Cmr1